MSRPLVSAFILFFVYPPYINIASAQGFTDMLGAYDAVQPTTQALPYGGQTSSGTTASTKTDLDSVLKILLQGGDLGDILAEELAEFDFNLKTNRYGTWKFRGGVEVNPDLYPRLVTALDGANLMTLKDQLSGQIDSFDSYTAEILLSPESKEDVGRQAQFLENAYYWGVQAQRQLAASSVDEQNDGKELVFSTLDPATRRMFAASLDNRGKMTFSAKSTIRSGLTGPDETSISIGYERGIGSDVDSIQRLLSANSSCIFAESWTMNRDLPNACLSAAAIVPALITEAEKQERIAISLKYSEIDGFSYIDQASSFSQNYKSTKSFALSVAYGRNFRPPISKAQGARFDAAFTFDDVKDNAELNDRGLLQATYTIDFGDFEVPIALTWSNKSELVGDADAKLGGHIGIQYRRQKK